ncbi:MAG: glycoside hydrolase family protein, partial [Flavobacterium sp.]
VKGTANQQDYGMRIYDPRLVRFLSEDPITKKYPELTPYQFASNCPIEGVDLDGLEKITYVYKFAADQIVKTKIVHAKAGPLGNGVLVKSDFGGVKKYFYGNEIPNATLPLFKASYEGVAKDKNGNHVYYTNDGKGIPTIGYGHRVVPGDPYKPGSTITETEAVALFNKDQKTIFTRADGYLKGLNLTVNQRNALYDLSFNGGPGKVMNFRNEKGKYAGENYFLKPSYLGDVEGNVKRRYADNLLFSEGCISI